MAQGTTRGVPIDIDPLLTNDSDLLVPSQKAIKTYVDTNTSNAVSTKVSRSGDTMSGSLILSGDPIIPFGAATKSYVDTLINGIDWKTSANAATTTALPTYTVSGAGQILTGTVTLGLIDGVILTTNQRILVKNEISTKTPNNGIYVVTQVNPFILTRSNDANTSALIAEATISVADGDTLSNTQWHCNPATIPIIIGTTYITFAEIGSGTYSFSPPLVVSGSVISIPSATNSVDGYLSSTDWTTFNTAYTSRIATFSVTGNSGAATFSGNTLNIPEYTLSGLDGVSVSGIQTITGNKTFSNDLIVNGIKIGRGGSNIASNTAIGFQSLLSNTSGYFNTAIGYQSLYNNTTGNLNTAIGFQSLFSNTSGSNNIAIGNSLALNTTGYFNTAIGSLALAANTTGYDNIAIGYNSLPYNTTGYNNVALGDNAGYNITTGSFNTLIGNGASTSTPTDSSSIVIGCAATGIGSNTTVIGDGSTVKTGIFGRTLIGTPTLPTDDLTSALQINGYVSATGYKVPSATGFLKANGSVDTTTYVTGSGTATGTNTGDVTLATNSGLSFTFGQTLLNLGTPSNITASTTNSVTTNTHTHGITPSLGFIGSGSAQYQVAVTGATPFTPTWTSSAKIYGSGGLNSLTYASTSFVKMTGTNTFTLDTNTYAGTVSPTFTGTPSAPTATFGTNTTQLATTAYVTNAVATGNPVYNILIESTLDITTETTGTSGVGSYSQNGRNVMISNGVIAIFVNATVLSTATDFIASYTKIGTADITFTFTGTGATLIAPNGAILNGTPGSTALLTKNGTTVYLLINNLL